ncbi:spheroidene monooxygenase [Parasulfitobacter algicola]|uniref:Spheroidene monooxygenase n=1 Tax=Parasulfitobacter algicola TaxID=2614809 RepID=A0ABX2ISS9_9RHOB|nr:spheroidene monooxygenase [Sulfitobacter algicola]NSX53346.1 spheroidene monooxygenase [Sulfitobacter algicola]
MGQTVSLSFFRFATPQARLWALTMMGAARFAMPKIPNLHFWKLCGSGTGEGFTPIPNTAVYAILCAWPDLDIARNRIENETLFLRYRQRAAENWSVFLSPTSVRGAWSGKTPFVAQNIDNDAPIAALTRATVKAGVLHRFWRQVPDISAVIGADPNVLFKIGIGEIPWLHQVTFSIWPDADAMAQFARKDGPHARAIKSVREGNWFREELYARFTVVGDDGTWGGASPLKRSEAA